MVNTFVIMAGGGKRLHPHTETPKTNVEIGQGRCLSIILQAKIQGL